MRRFLKFNVNHLFPSSVRFMPSFKKDLHRDNLEKKLVEAVDAFKFRSAGVGGKLDDYLDKVLTLPSKVMPFPHPGLIPTQVDVCRPHANLLHVHAGFLTTNERRLLVVDID